MMKYMTAFCYLALFAASGSSVAIAQSKPGPPPPIGKASVNSKGRRHIPPAPPISSARYRARKSAATASMGAHHTPGTDTSGRTDMSAKPNALYPVSKGVDFVDPAKQKRGPETFRKRITK
jgi:hypothetical protein